MTLMVLCFTISFCESILKISRNHFTTNLTLYFLMVHQGFLSPYTPTYFLLTSSLVNKGPMTKFDFLLMHHNFLLVHHTLMTLHLSTLDQSVLRKWFLGLNKDQFMKWFRYKL